MKRIHLIRTTVAADAVAGIVTDAASQGLRIGWLDLTPAPTAGGSASGLGQLERAAEIGTLRAVAFAGGRTVAVKRITGPPTLRDLVREHFLGCTAVLVRVPAGGSEPPVDGAGELALLEPLDDGWQVVPPGASPAGRSEVETLHLTTAELVARLRRPRPWGGSADRSD